MTPAERDLCAVTRALFEPETAPMVVPVLRRRTRLPDRWSPRTVRTLEDFLTKGLVLRLARAGATRAASLVDGALREGTAWERLGAPRLAVSEASRALLVWLVEAELGAPKAPTFDAPPATLADEVLYAAVAERLAALRLAAVVPLQPGLVASPLVWWTTPEPLLGGVAPTASTATPPAPAAVERWGEGTGADLLSCLGADLAERWAAQETVPRRDVGRASAVGRARAAVLEPLVRRALAAGRPDACAFLLGALGRWIPPESAPYGNAASPWTRPFDGAASLGARTEARRDQLASLRAVGLLAADARRVRQVGFVDDDWDEAQTRLRFYAPYDEGRLERARELVSHVESLSFEEPS